ncbi:MAG: DUF4833 domain-containing protein [Flavobacteriales bacterium]|nr:DUF4833 domain-containing protein [Flavobacteriales bacterium]MCB9334577.1 DUF4833 domain-containing protein [Flavobacteriales bacterium]
MIKHFIPLLFLALPFLFGFNIQTSSNISHSFSNDEDSVFNNYPTPTDKNMLFYIQKSFNTNAVVYTLNIDKTGNIDEKNPINVFWRRYQEQGQKRELKYIEKTFGYGVKYKFLEEHPNTVEFEIVAIKNRKLIASINKKGLPIVVSTINGKPAYLEKVFITAQHEKLLPEVFAIELFGKELKTGKKAYEKIEK